jgi:hypothetical protein
MLTLMLSYKVQKISGCNSGEDTDRDLLAL